MSKCQEHEFKIETIREWRTKYEDYFRKKKIQTFSMKKVSRPSLVPSEMLTETISILTNIHVSGTAITRKLVIAVENGVFNRALYEELTFSSKEKIVQIVLEHNIPEKMILNFYQTPFGFTSPNKTTYTDKESESVPITNEDDKDTLFLSGEKFSFFIASTDLPVISKCLQ